MEIVRCAVNCTFKHFFSCEPVLKPSRGSGSLLAAELVGPCTMCPNGYSANQSLDLERNFCSNIIVRERNVFYYFLPAVTVELLELLLLLGSIWWTCLVFTIQGSPSLYYFFWMGFISTLDLLSFHIISHS